MRPRLMPRLGSPALIAEAQQLFDCARHDEALQAFRKVAARHPRDPRVLLAAARAHALRHEYAKAREFLESVLQFVDAMPEIHQAVGEVYRAAQLPEDALRHLRLALALRPSIATCLELATLAERAHAMEEALAAIELGLAMVPGEPGLLILRAIIARRKGLPDEAESTLRSVLSREDLSLSVRGRALGELAELYDSVGSYAQAWSTIESCKALLRPSAQPMSDVASHIDARYAALSDAVNADATLRWRRRAARQDARVALLAGFPRSGTSLLDVRLDHLAGTRMIEELDVFASRTLRGFTAGHAPDAPLFALLDQAREPTLARLATDYLRVMSEWSGKPLRDAVLVDKNPANLLLVPAYLRVFPQCRFLIALRDPRDVLLSCYLRYLPVNPVSVNFLHLDSLVSRYLLDMRLWLKLAPLLEDQCHIVRYEDLVMNSAVVIAEAAAFLGVDAAETKPHHRRIVNTPSYAQVTVTPHAGAVARWRHYEDRMRPCLARLAPVLDVLGYAN